MKKIKLTEDSFRILVSYWAGKLQLPLPLFCRNNRMKWSALVTYCKDCRAFSITYNFKNVLDIEESEVAGLVFHELGHIKHKTYRLIKNKVKSEYLAERHSLDCLKKYYPDFYEIEVKGWKKRTKEKVWRKEFPIHAKAFDKIKEYK